VSHTNTYICFYPSAANEIFIKKSIDRIFIGICPFGGYLLGAIIHVYLCLFAFTYFAEYLQQKTLSLLQRCVRELIFFIFFYIFLYFSAIFCAFLYFYKLSLFFTLYTNILILLFTLLTELIK